MKDKEKIAFVVHRFGKEVNGGAEVHVRMIAEHLLPYYDIDILTTTIKNWEDRTQDYTTGDEMINGLTVKRFPAIQVDYKKYNACRKKARRGRKIRQTLYKMGILESVANIFPEFTIKRKAEINFFEQYPAHSPALLDYLKQESKQYKKIFFMTYYFSNTLLGGMIDPERSILIPTAHFENELFYSLYTSLFTRIRHIAFNTTAEQQMCRNIFGKSMSPNSIIATGVELKSAAEWAGVKNKYNLPDEYILYLGRVTLGKINTLLDDFISFKQKTGSNIKLVLTGGIDSNIPVDKSEDIIFTNFVSEHEKTAIIEHATFMVNPSGLESLSLLLLEGLSKGIPVIVNGNCDVMKEHCIQSDGACCYFLNQEEMHDLFSQLLSSASLRKSMGEKGKEYVAKNYAWEVVVGKLRCLIENQ